MMENLFLGVPGLYTKIFWWGQEWPHDSCWGQKRPQDLFNVIIFGPVIKVNYTLVNQILYPTLFHNHSSSFVIFRDINSDRFSRMFTKVRVELTDKFISFWKNSLLKWAYPDELNHELPSTFAKDRHIWRIVSMKNGPN